jgi:feruloyl esterase
VIDRGAFRVPSVPFTGLATPGSGLLAPANPQDLQSFCRVIATLHPTSDSDVGMELWLPLSDWNGKLLAIGNAGWGGTIMYTGLMDGMRRGYATTSTDTGHQGSSGEFALGHPEKLVDFSYRAVHEMTVAAKSAVSAFYGRAPRHAYFTGCSTGGGQALKAAQRFPNDFDGIVAGDPGNFWSHQLVQSIWVYQAAHRTPESPLTADKLKLLHAAVLANCDAKDGLRDGLLANPTTCRFDPGVLQCPGVEDPSCLSPAQVTAARQIYSAPTRSDGHKPIFPPLMRGSELLWATGLAGPAAPGYAVDFFKVVYHDPAWDPMGLTLERATNDADRTATLINGTDPNLAPFFAHGGKLLHFHGWSDQLISPQNSIDYYESVVRALGNRRRVEASYRLFMAPGMAHCRDGEGPNVFDALRAIERWVEEGAPPIALIASHATDGKVHRTRPLCPYPQVARYRGSGSIDDAANFVCR